MGRNRGGNLVWLLAAFCACFLLTSAAPTGVSTTPSSAIPSPLRLVNGNTQYDGILQVNINGTWGTVCDDLWTSRESEVACGVLFGSGYTGEARSASQYPTQTAPILMDDVTCIGIETTLFACQFTSNHNCVHYEDVGLECSNAVSATPGSTTSSPTIPSPLRLVNGNTQSDGILQVNINGIWGTVCDDSWTSRESEVACRILFGSGYTGEARSASQYPTQTAPILMDDVTCTGFETTLFACQFTSNHNCDHSEDVGLECSNAVDDGWSDWDDWQDYDECSALCGGGRKDQWRTRRCDNPAPAYGGNNCVGADAENQTVECNTQDCGDRCPEGKNTFIANANKTGRYYQCDNGVARLRECADGTVWDQDSISCVHDGSQQVPLHPGSKCDPDFMYSAHQDCTKFIVCVQGSAFEMSCPAGMRYNPAITTCDFADNVPCN